MGRSGESSKSPQSSVGEGGLAGALSNVLECTLVTVGLLEICFGPSDADVCGTGGESKREPS